MTNSQRYTVVLDDDPIVARFIQKALNLRAMAFSSAQTLLASAKSLQPVAAFIDIHLESESGLRILPELRSTWAFAPLIVITSDGADAALTEALSSGADDFIRKPIRPSELASRLHTRLVDQAQKEAKHLIQIEDVAVDREHQSLRGPKGNRYLSSTEMNLFLSLLQAQGSVVSRSTLKLRCWGQIAVSDNALDRKIYELRRALKDVGAQIEVGTSYGTGFCLATPLAKPPQSAQS